MEAAEPKLVAFSALHGSIGKRLHEAHQRIFLLVRKPEPSDELRVHVIGGLWRRPAGGARAGVICATAPQDVARVVEVDDRLKATSHCAHRL